jgi:cobalt-zinc-cadmium efflux system membrane fusion protein
VQQRAIEDRLTVTGEVVANPTRTIVIAPRTTGRVVRVLAELGQTVEAGATVALLDSLEATDLLAELRQSDSALALAQSRFDREKQLYEAKLRVLETARNQPDARAALGQLQKVELGRPKQEYISALAKLELARADYERQKLLNEAKIGARKELIRAEKELYVAQSEQAAVDETIRLTARQDLLAAETALRDARSQRDKVHEKLRLLGFSDAALARSAGREHGQRSLIPLVAPFTGTLIERQVTEGQLVDPSSAPFRIADLRTVWALLDVPESAIAAVRRDQEVVVEAGRETRLTHTGRLVYIGDVVEEPTRTVKVRVEIPNAERHFKPGMFVTAQIATRQAGPATLMVPKDAVFVMDERLVVFVEGEDGFRPRAVQVGPEAGGWVPVQKGLRAGEKVVTEGGFALKAQLVKAKLGEE